ncbi:hypothetical protein NQZ68_008017 [Dissostichus eleginoides]|nr:hypothetical protein NQZ68_008017 [Dissostichus eleginoides]
MKQQEQDSHCFLSQPQLCAHTLLAHCHLSLSQALASSPTAPARPGQHMPPPNIHLLPAGLLRISSGPVIETYTVVQSLARNIFRVFHHSSSCKRVIISTSGDFERGSLLMLLLLRLDQAELSSQVDKDLCSARGKLSSRNKKPRGTKTTICQNTHLKTTKQPKKRSLDAALALHGAKASVA